MKNFDTDDPECIAACKEAFRLFPDEIEPVDYHPRGKIVVDRGNLRFAFIEGWRYASGQS
jgi:hypothetical protein